MRLVLALFALFWTVPASALSVTITVEGAGTGVASVVDDPYNVGLLPVDVAVSGRGSMTLTDDEGFYIFVSNCIGILTVVCDWWNPLWDDYTDINTVFGWLVNGGMAPVTNTDASESEHLATHSFWTTTTTPTNMIGTWSR